MDLEFHESDIVFSDEFDRLVPDHDPISEQNHHEDVLCDVSVPDIFYHDDTQFHRKKVVGTESSSSPPMAIPTSSILLRSPGDQHTDDSVEEEEVGGEGGMVPPHVITGTRVAGKMASLDYARNGRMLKGRYLSEVRNSILRMTGYLES